jgi:hypothetical protein
LTKISSLSQLVFCFDYQTIKTTLKKKGTRQMAKATKKTTKKAIKKAAPKKK